MIIIALCLSFGTALSITFNVTIPADKAYDQTFHSDIVMLTEGATSLVGSGVSDVGSMHFYLMRIWNTMNATWNTATFSTTYANEENFWIGTLGERVPHNSLLATNQYFNSLNQTLYQKQRIIDDAQAGSYGSDAVQIAVSNTREEINAYGGIDWVIHDLYMHDYQPAAYWSPITMLTATVFALLIGIFGIIIAALNSD